MSNEPSKMPALLALVLDFGGVLSVAPARGAFRPLADDLGVTLDDFLAAYWAERGPYDAGLDADEYWGRVSTRLLGGRLASRASIDVLIDRDAAAWSVLREEVWELAREFRARGGKTAFLSNNVVPLMARLRAARRFDEYFDVVVASCEVGICKPDERVFRTCLDRLGVTACDALFVDDVADNVAAASGLGMQTLLFAGDDGTDELRRHLTTA